MQDIHLNILVEKKGVVSYSMVGNNLPTNSAGGNYVKQGGMVFNIL